MGKKFDFTKVTTRTPAPNQYEIEAVSAKNAQTRRGFSFGLSREVILNVVFTLYPSLSDYRKCPFQEEC